MNTENKKSSPDPDNHAPLAKGSNGRPPETPAAVPSKKFPRADETKKRGPGRPPKNSQQRGAVGSPAARAEETSAAAPAPSFTAKPDELAGTGIRGLLQTSAAIAAGITHFAVKLPMLDALQIWQFSEEQLKQIEGPGGPFLEKYAPALDAYGIEMEFAAAVLPIFTGKIFAIVAAKRALDAEAGKRPVSAKPAPRITPIRQDPPAEPAAAPDVQTPTRAEAAAAAATPPGAPPSAFAHDMIDRSAELL